MAQIGADGEFHPASGDVVGEGVGGAGGVAAHQDLHPPRLVRFPQAGGQLSEGVIQDGDVVRGGVRAGVPAAQQAREGFPGAALAVIAEHQ
ncbi:hypothetical protein JOF56_000896 [Kibdelosporangium banguiense]|uniref:Uncharacterized protein n=1 Tax=Kibdelosporangium banguiense TaxID=1365924 RepID=A0ABS4T869_9PSEU|nr:hypothetical protein [Kibdelosporangium banguiense]